MEIRDIQKNFITNRLPLFFTLVVFVATRAVLSDYMLWELWAATAIQISTAFVLLSLSQVFVVIRQRTLLPAFFYLLFVGAFPQYFDDWEGSLIAFDVLLCFYVLFATYQQRNSQGGAFNISVLLTLGSFLWTPMLYFFPLFWYGLYRFKSLNVRTFLASWMGFAIIYLFIFAWSIYQNDEAIFFDLLPVFELQWHFDLDAITLRERIIVGYLAFLLVLAGSEIFMSGISEKVRAITTLGFLYVATIAVFIFFELQICDVSWQLIVYIPSALLLAHYFTLSAGKWTSWLFVLTVSFFVAILVNHYIPLVPLAEEYIDIYFNNP
ncbi:hypothetical protein AGMMS49965_11410 [Bacteroidia bacterium]|nr:hypothetical protein AGMMS49965_11410 [Bacteroidia bacterium]